MPARAGAMPHVGEPYDPLTHRLFLPSDRADSRVRLRRGGWSLLRPVSCLNADPPPDGLRVEIQHAAAVLEGEGPTHFATRHPAARLQHPDLTITSAAGEGLDRIGEDGAHEGPFSLAGPAQAGLELLAAGIDREGAPPRTPVRGRVRSVVRGPSGREIERFARFRLLLPGKASCRHAKP